MSLNNLCILIHMSESLKILTWNCNGAFRNKFKLLDKFDADLLIIQECENPALSKNQDYAIWSNNYIWHGKNANKGLGVFAKKSIHLEKLDWNDEDLKYFIPCKINSKFNLLAVWCHGANSPTFGYIGQLWKYMQLHKSKFNKVFIAGDFNSNVIWDKWDRWWNHSDVLKELEELNVFSLYHQFNKEKAGLETQPTFYHRKNIDKSYHIDYIFASKDLISTLDTYEVHKHSEWLDFSDHMPIVCNVKI